MRGCHRIEVPWLGAVKLLGWGGYGWVPWVCDGWVRHWGAMVGCHDAGWCVCVLNLVVLAPSLMACQAGVAGCDG